MISLQNEIRRKLVHLSSLWMPVVMAVFASWRYGLAFFFFLLTISSILLEHAYARNNPAIRKLYDLFFGNMLRKDPQKNDWIISGGPPVLAAACVTLILFPPILAAAAMAVMLIGDTAAALIGRKWGRIRFSNGKSLEGSIAFVIAGSIGFFMFYVQHAGFSPYLVMVSFIAAFTGSIVEFFQNRIRLDDNLLIPLVSGVTAWFFL